MTYKCPFCNTSCYDDDGKITKRCYESFEHSGVCNIQESDTGNVVLELSKCPECGKVSVEVSSYHKSQEKIIPYSYPPVGTIPLPEYIFVPPHNLIVLLYFRFRKSSRGIAMFYERLISLCSKSGTDVSNVLRSIGLSTSKGTAWKGGAIPKGDVLLKLAHYFHVSTDYLLGNTDDPTLAGQKETPTPGRVRSISDEELKFALWGDTDVIDDSDIEDVRRYAAFLEERKRKK